MELFKTENADQRSHTFTTSDGNMRLTIGQYTTDGYRDTVEDGIAIVKEYITSLAKDTEHRHWLIWCSAYCPATNRAR